MRRSSITRLELEHEIEAWGSGAVSSSQLCEWVEANYFPLHQEVGPGEPPRTQKTMHSILNAFEHALPSDADPTGSTSAIRFVRTSKSSFPSLEQEFRLACFKSHR